MQYDFARSCAVITGGSSGIGAATAKRLAGLGARVVIAARSRDRLRRLAAQISRIGGHCVAVPCDVSRRADNERLIATAVELFGRVDILVLNAGRGHAQSVEHTSEATLDTLFRLNVFGLFYGVQAALPVMRSQGEGRIITVASMAGKLPMPYATAYVASKHAAVGFSNALRLELLGTGIHASVVCPGNVATPWAASTAGLSMLDLARAAQAEATRIARAHEIVPVDTTVLPARAVADAIVEVIERPVAEVYTHPDGHESVVAAACDAASAERAATPMALAMRAAYPTLVAASAAARAAFVDGEQRR